MLLFPPLLSQLLKFVYLILIIYLYYFTNLNLFKYLFKKHIKHANIFIIKLLQWISEQYQLIPPSIVELFALLKHQFPYHDSDHTQKIIERNFGNLQIFDNTFVPISSG